MRLTPEQQEILKHLMFRIRVGVLGVNVDGVPVNGLLPYAMTPGCRSVIVFASSLAKHTRGLVDGAAYTFLVHLPDDPGGDAFQVPRLSLHGRVARIERETQAFDAAWGVYAAKLPQVEILFPLKDFNFYELQIDTARFVAGFAAAHTLRPHELSQLAE